MFDMGPDSVLRNATCCPTCISLGEASKAVWPVQATPPNMLRFNMLNLLILLYLCSLTTETSSTSQVSSLDHLQTTFSFAQSLVPHCIKIFENMDIHILIIYEYVTHHTFEHDFNIWLQGGESGQLPLLDSTFEGIPQNQFLYVRAKPSIKKLVTLVTISNIKATFWSVQTKMGPDITRPWPTQTCCGLVGS